MMSWIRMDVPWQMMRDGCRRVKGGQVDEDRY